MTLRQRYKKLTLWNKITFWGSVASILALFNVHYTVFSLSFMAFGPSQNDLVVSQQSSGPVPNPKEVSKPYIENARDQLNDPHQTISKDIEELKHSIKNIAADLKQRDQTRKALAEDKAERVKIAEHSTSPWLLSTPVGSLVSAGGYGTSSLLSSTVSLGTTDGLVKPYVSSLGTSPGVTDGLKLIGMSDSTGSLKTSGYDLTAIKIPAIGEYGAAALTGARDSTGILKTSGYGSTGIKMPAIEGYGAATLTGIPDSTGVLKTLGYDSTIKPLVTGGYGTSTWLTSGMPDSAGVKLWGSDSTVKPLVIGGYLTGPPDSTEVKPLATAGYVSPWTGILDNTGALKTPGYDGSSPLNRGEVRLQ